MEQKPLLYTLFLLAADKAEQTKPVPSRQCHLHLLMTSSQSAAQEWKTDATSSSSEWPEQKDKEGSCILVVGGSENALL